MSGNKKQPIGLIALEVAALGAILWLILEALKP